MLTCGKGPRRLFLYASQKFSHASQTEFFGPKNKRTLVISFIIISINSCITKKAELLPKNSYLFRLLLIKSASTGVGTELKSWITPMAFCKVFCFLDPRPRCRRVRLHNQSEPIFQIAN